MDNEKAVNRQQTNDAINRGLDSLDRASKDVRNLYADLASKHFDSDLRMEEEENKRIWEDSNLTTAEKVRYSKENRESHNEQRIKAVKETAPVAENAINVAGQTIGRVMLTGGVAASVVSGLAAVCLGNKDVVQHMARGFVIGALGSGGASLLMENN